MHPTPASEVDLSRYIRPGDRVVLAQATAEPQTLARLLIAQRHRFPGVEVFIGPCYTDLFAAAETDGLRFVISAKTLLEGTIAKTWREIVQRLHLYDRAYEGLTHEQNPEGFRSFLTSGSTLFIELGDRIGRLEQLVSFWEFRLSQHHTGGMSPDEVMDAMRDLLQGLSIWPAVTPPPPAVDLARTPAQSPGASRRATTAR